MPRVVCERRRFRECSAISWCGKKIPSKSMDDGVFPWVDLTPIGQIKNMQYAIIW